MSLITIRPGVQFRPDAAASFRRYEHALGRPADVNRTTSSYAVQDNLYRLRQAGKYPYSVANPRTSNHVYRSDTDGGNAWDTDERGPLLDEHGWLATVKGEPWHREYHQDHDQHLHDQEGDMSAKAEQQIEAVYAAIFGPANIPTEKTTWAKPFGEPAGVAYYGIFDVLIAMQGTVAANAGKLAALQAAVQQLSAGTGVTLDMTAITAAAERGAHDALASLVLRPELAS